MLSALHRWKSCSQTYRTRMHTHMHTHMQAVVWAWLSPCWPCPCVSHWSCISPPFLIGWRTNNLHVGLKDSADCPDSLPSSNTSNHSPFTSLAVTLPTTLRWPPRSLAHYWSTRAVFPSFALSKFRNEEAFCAQRSNFGSSSGFSWDPVLFFVNLLLLGHISRNPRLFQTDVASWVK